MFICYLVCVDDIRFVYEDGLGFIESGATREEALLKMRSTWDENEKSVYDGDDSSITTWEELIVNHYYRIFTVEPGILDSTICHNDPTTA